MRSCVNPRVLFICKHRHSYGYASGLSSGLLNSVKFISDMLNDDGIESKVVDVIDNNNIDKEVYTYKPTHVFIEALWVVPSKFKELIRLHPHVKWVIRLHSEVPFMAMEGISFDWLFDYVKYKNVSVATNSNRAQEVLQYQLQKYIHYLPNYYPVDFSNTDEHTNHHDYIDIGCFGAIRPFKNHLSQALAAIEFANDIGKTLRFHINHERIEGWNSESILKNLISLFENNPEHELINHYWMPHHDFIHLIRKMDIGMQVSFTETFNIVAADFANNNIPIVVSDEVRWASSFFKADPNSVSDIVHILKRAWFWQQFGIQDLNKIGLSKFSRKSEHLWKEYFYSCEE
jgi:hypothetical protein